MLWIFPVLLLLRADVSGEEILLINSNAKVEKYRIVQEEFTKNFAMPVRQIDMNDDHISGKKLREDPAALFYCIGAKAYSLCRSNIGDRPLVFSSIINWQRFSPSSEAYGVSNELNARMPIYMFRSVFPDVKKIAVLYSREYTLQWFTDTVAQAKELEIDLRGKAVSGKRSILPALAQMLPEVQALWLIPDPRVMPEKKYLYDILEKCHEKQIPVFTYHSAFVRLGAVMSVAVDNPTIGRQAAGIAQELLSGKKPADRVQFPAGSEITLDLKKAGEYGLKYNRDALGLVNYIIR
ncbi:MAG: ABC transporter substrate binding protein [Desulfococcaceae bacterium]|jgi:putative ABC transport system substrate-binding protein|nr:ABC transporter substrate binding protein [Desulfococcaceae bacterium]